MNEPWSIANYDVHPDTLIDDIALRTAPILDDDRWATSTGRPPALAVLPARGRSRPRSAVVCGRARPALRWRLGGRRGATPRGVTERTGDWRGNRRQQERTLGDRRQPPTWPLAGTDERRPRGSGGRTRRLRGREARQGVPVPEDDLVRLKLRDFDRGRVEFLIEVGDVKRAHVADQSHVPDAPGRPPDFAMMLRNRLSGADLVRVEQFEFDRIIELEFDREDASTTIVAELFGDGNVAVRTNTARSSTVLKRSGSIPNRRTRDAIQFPSARFNPMTVDYDGIVARSRNPR